MNRFWQLLLLLLAIFAIPSPASAALKPDDDPTVLEGLRDKGFDWLKDQAKDAGKEWIFGTDQSETMHAILLQAQGRADGEGNDKNGLCQGPVMGKASSILHDINAEWSVKTGARLMFDTAVKMASLASGFGAAAGEGNALNWLVEQYTDAAKEQGKDAVFDRIKKLFVDEKKPEFELYETKGKNGDCDYTLRAVWDIVHGTYRVYIAGDCHCATIGNAGAIPRPVGEWWISFEGHLTLQIDESGKTAVWVPGPPIMDFDAQCACSKKKLRTAFAPPVRETVTGGGSSVGPPPLPPAGRKVCKECQKIQDEIDADTKALGEAQAQVRQLAGELGGAENTLAYDKAHPRAGASPQDIQAGIDKDQAEINRIKAESRRLEGEQVRLEAQLRDLGTLLEECIKGCTHGKTSTTQPAPATPPAVPPQNKKNGISYEPNPFASRVLEIHNAERAAVGAQPLRWNEQLAQDAINWAGEMARTRQEIHAPREGRGIERENLLKAPLGWTPDHMMRLWTDEKRDFVAGYFPNVARDGNWANVSHYTQMIWPTTTDLGCGSAEGGGYVWLVCRYSPGGNKDGKPVGLAAHEPERGM